MPTMLIAFIRKTFLPALLVTVTYLSVSYDSRFQKGSGEGMEEDISGRVGWMNRMLADPSTGEIPLEMRNRELSFASHLPVWKDGLAKSDYGIWVQRGPGNVGGRTRAIAIDRTNENILLAGATAGGIWRSMDAGYSWQRMTPDTDYIPASCIVQDPRPGKSLTWYAGTGELYGSALPGGYIYGYGVRKSVDGGKTWTRCTTTFSPNPVYDNSFDFVHRLAFNPAIDSIEVVFAATIDGIYRSIDGGKTWARRKGGSSAGPSYWSDVAITRNGVIYIAFSSGGSAGIYRSTNNGQTWTNITPVWFDANVGRIVMAIAPSDENQIYFTAYSPGSGKKSVNFNGTEEYNSLWKYTYVSGDGTGSGGVWENRSANIPVNFPGDFGQFISQQGYSLHIDVKPDDPNVVFLGGTNLYRSTDGFATDTKISQVGGYAYGTVRPDYQMYPNHHPDQHGVIFYPSNPKRAISVDDGGIQRTEDCLATSINWNSLNHGYVTTQFYTVAIDHTTSNDVLMGGLQDNGTQMTHDADYTKDWFMPYSSDGSFCYVGPNASEYYVSIQEGRVYRIILDQNKKLAQMARLDPKGLNKSRYQFINPFAVDASNWRRLYIPNGNTLWRNQDITQIPLHTQIDSNAVLTGWEELVSARLPDSTDEITAITSCQDPDDVIYFGTMRGKLYKLTGASQANPMVTAITGTNFPLAYINCITVDPTDVHKLYCVFSNYGVLSIFHSADSGNSWTAVSGNLEQSPSGSGNGPSCRWFTVAPLQDSTLYFVGTSSGLFATSKINGMNTVWTRQGPGSIGLNMVTMMDFRTTDNTLAVSTYGAGAFTARISSTDRTGTKPSPEKLSLKLYPVPATDKLYLQTTERDSEFTLQLLDLKGQIVLQTSIKQTNPADISHLGKGIYIARILGHNLTYCSKICIQ